MNQMTKNDWMYKVLDLKLEIAKADDDLNDLRSYLLSDKFHGDSTVQVSDVLRRLGGVKLYSTTDTEPMNQPAPAKRINKTVARVKREGYCIERCGSRWEVWHPERLGVTAIYDRLADIEPSPLDI